MWLFDAVVEMFGVSFFLRCFQVARRHRFCFLCLLLIIRIKGAEARRRITFFVNSLFVEQPKKRRVLEMPSLTTLTPYYNEDVVSTTFFLPSCDVGGSSPGFCFACTIPPVDHLESFVRRHCAHAHAAFGAR